MRAENLSIAAASPRPIPSEESPAAGFTRGVGEAPQPLATITHPAGVERKRPVRYSAVRLFDLATFVKSATAEETFWRADKIIDFIDMPIKAGIVYMPCGGFRDIEKVKKVAAAFMAEHGIPAEVMNTRSRDLVLVQCRREVWRHLRSRGVSFPLIENATGFAHGTIVAGTACHVSTFDLINRLPAKKLAEAMG